MRITAYSNGVVKTQEQLVINTFLFTFGPPSAFLSTDNHPFAIALLKPILAPGHEFYEKLIYPLLLYTLKAIDKNRDNINLYK